MEGSIDKTIENSDLEFGSPGWGTSDWYSALDEKQKKQHNENYAAAHAAAIARDEADAKRRRDLELAQKYRQDVNASMSKNQMETDFFNKIISGNNRGYIENRTRDVGQEQKNAAESYSSGIKHYSGAEKQALSSIGKQNVESKLSPLLATARIQDKEIAQKQIDTLNKSRAEMAQGLGITSLDQLQKIWETAQKNQAENAISQAEAEANKYIQDKSFLSNLISGGVQAGATAAMLSDENAKTDISNSDIETKDFLDKLQEYSYNYKGEDDKRLGVMAQDVEKSNVGSKVVKDIGGMKALDANKTISALLASVANLNKRLERFE